MQPRASIEARSLDCEKFEQPARGCIFIQVAQQIVQTKQGLQDGEVAKRLFQRGANRDGQLSQEAKEVRPCLGR